MLKILIMGPTRINDAVYWFMSELTSRVVAQTGRPQDRYHLGKIILQSFIDYPDTIMQIDGATGVTETNASIMDRSIKCAKSFRNLNLVPGDVMITMALNHLDVAVPFYASLYTGVIIAAIDSTLGAKELEITFEVSRPKIVFCQSEKAPAVQAALNEIKLKAHVVTFDHSDGFCLADLIANNADNEPAEKFEPTDFDPEETIGFLIATSGTTGLPKFAEITHKHFFLAIQKPWQRFNTFPNPYRMAMLFSPMQWVTALSQYIASPIYNFTRLQSSLPVEKEHAYCLINTYKPTFAMITPALLTSLTDKATRDECDLTSFEVIVLAGSPVPKTLLDDIMSVMPNTELINLYGMSELAGIAFMGDFPPHGSCGKQVGCFEYRLVNVDSREDIVEPFVTGELWLKGPAVCKGYYGDKKATAKAFKDGWFKTGDLFYRDENWNYFYIERLKFLLKYKTYQISPLEVENVIREHPGVLNVAVTGIADIVCGDLPVACVVTRDGYNVTADEIKNLVKGTLTDTKHLRGGVVFLKSLPLTPSTKVNRSKLKELVATLKRE